MKSNTKQSKANVNNNDTIVVFGCNNKSKNIILGKNQTYVDFIRHGFIRISVFPFPLRGGLQNLPYGILYQG